MAFYSQEGKSKYQSVQRLVIHVHCTYMYLDKHPWVFKINVIVASIGTCTCTWDLILICTSIGAYSYAHVHVYSSPWYLYESFVSREDTATPVYMYV